MKVCKITTNTWTIVETNKYPTKKLQLKEEYLPNDVFVKEQKDNNPKTKNLTKKDKNVKV